MLMLGSVSPLLNMDQAEMGVHGSMPTTVSLARIHSQRAPLWSQQLLEY